jgi:hypothetical protein
MWLELEIANSESPRLAGNVGRVGGQRHTFTGVMELIAVIERLLDEIAPHDGGE